MMMLLSSSLIFTTRQRTILSDFALPSCGIGNVLDTAARRNAPKSVQRFYRLLCVIRNRYQSGDHLHFSPPHFYWYREMNAAVRVWFQNGGYRAHRSKQ